jgi:aryl-alcohol dehydrogenase-like predicted oxidoreductase
MQMSNSKHNHIFNKLCIGTAQFGMHYGIMNETGVISTSEIKSILDYAKLNHIKTIDTARSYGESEKSLGLYGMQNFNVITKLPSLEEGHVNIEQWVLENIEKSLANLNQPSIYAVLVHQCKDLLGSHGHQITLSLNKLKEKEIIKNIGVSIYSPDDIPKILDVMIPDIIQAPVNIFDRRLSESGWMKKLSQLNIKIHARSIFLQGVALKNSSELPEYFHQWKHQFDQWENFLNSAAMTAMTACLHYPLSMPEIDKLIVGVDNQSQFIQIVDAINMVRSKIDIPNFETNDLNLISPINWRID